MTTVVPELPAPAASRTAGHHVLRRLVGVGDALVVGAAALAATLAHWIDR